MHQGSSSEIKKDHQKCRTTLIISLKNEVDSLVEIFKGFQVGGFFNMNLSFEIIFSWSFFKIVCMSSLCYAVQEKNVNLLRIESRKSRHSDSDFEIYLDCDTDQEQLEELIQMLRKHNHIVETTHFNATLSDNGKL